MFHLFKDFLVASTFLPYNCNMAQCPQEGEMRPVTRMSFNMIYTVGLNARRRGKGCFAKLRIETIRWRYKIWSRIYFSKTLLNYLTQRMLVNLQRFAK